METATWIDRTGWASGPWDDEADRYEWREDGVPCLMIRHPRNGHWCGYAAVPPGHPWHGLDYSCSRSDCNEYPCEHELPNAAHDPAHGGLTFADRCMEDQRPQRERVCHVPQPGEPDDVWWLGFDCAHGFDRSPGREARDREMAAICRANGDERGAEVFGRIYPADGEYRTAPYVQSRCRDLAAAIRRAA